jgi:hypothetical protein
MPAAILRRALPACSLATALLAWASLLSACGSWDDHTAARTYSRELLACFDVEVERTESHRFHARGCEREADVVCSEGALNPVCIQVASRDTSGGEATEVVDGEDVDATTDEGVDEAPVRVASGATAEGASTEGATSEEAPSPAEQAIRRGLDARADDILACVDRSSVAVRVNHRADGGISITLSGDLRDSPEESCVRVAIGDVRVPGGAAGVVVHLVRARRAPEPPLATPTLETPPATPVATSTLTGEVVEELDE